MITQIADTVTNRFENKCSKESNAVRYRYKISVAQIFKRGYKCGKKARNVLLSKSTKPFQYPVHKHAMQQMLMDILIDMVIYRKKPLQ